MPDRLNIIKCSESTPTPSTAYLIFKGAYVNRYVYIVYIVPIKSKPTLVPHLGLIAVISCWAVNQIIHHISNIFWPQLQTMSRTRSRPLPGSCCRASPPSWSRPSQGGEESGPWWPPKSWGRCTRCPGWSLQEESNEGLGSHEVLSGSSWIWNTSSCLFSSLPHGSLSYPEILLKPCSKVEM